MNKFFIIFLSGVLCVAIGLSVSNYLSDQKHKPSVQQYNEVSSQNSTTEYDESNSNVFVAYQDGLKFTFYVNEDPNVIDLTVTDADSTHEFRSNGQVVPELRHTFVLQFDNDVDQGFVKRQYKFLIKEYYKTVALDFK